MDKPSSKTMGLSDDTFMFLHLSSIQHKLGGSFTCSTVVYAYTLSSSMNRSSILQQICYTKNGCMWYIYSLTWCWYHCESYPLVPVVNEVYRFYAVVVKWASKFTCISKKSLRTILAALARYIASHVLRRAGPISLLKTRRLPWWLQVLEV